MGSGLCCAPHSVSIYENKAIPLLKAAWDRGVNTIDTADLYSHGESERIIGKFIKQCTFLSYRMANSSSEGILIFTKCYFLCVNDPKMPTVEQPNLEDTRHFVNHAGLSRAAIFNAADASLARLQTSYIDFLQIHRFDTDTPPEETMKALHDLVQSGKVRYIGASSMRAWQFSELNHIAEKNGWTKFISMQDEYSLLYREEEREMIPYCKAHGIGIIPWGPLNGGDLARSLNATSARKELVKGTPSEKKFTEAERTMIDRVKKVAAKKGWSMSQVALAWLDKKVSSPIVGISSFQHLEANVITGKELSDGEVKYLEAPYELKKVRGHA